MSRRRGPVMIEEEDEAEAARQPEAAASDSSPPAKPAAPEAPPPGPEPEPAKARPEPAAAKTRAKAEARPEPARSKPRAKPKPRATVVEETEAADAANAAAPPPLEDEEEEDFAPGASPEPAAARAMRAAAGRRRATWGRYVWIALASLISLAVSIALYDFVAGLMARNPLLGTIGAALTAVVVLGVLGFAAREAAGMARLDRVDGMRREAETALSTADREAALRALATLRGLYESRKDCEWGLADLKARQDDLLEAEALLHHAERAVLSPLDARAEQAVGKAARFVAAATALVPVALADVAAALYANLRMIREVAEIYGGRAGWLGSWRLLKAVAGHLVATGAVAIGDDMIGAIAGGGAVSAVSRRFGEGIVNGALTARVGAAAIEVCRPLPFHVRPAPRGRTLAAGALKGMFEKGGLRRGRG